MPHDNYEDWYDNGTGSCSSNRKMRQSENDSKVAEFNRNRENERKAKLYVYLMESVSGFLDGIINEDELRKIVDEIEKE